MSDLPSQRVHRFKTTSILINQLLLASASAGERDVELVIDRRQAACDIASRLLEMARLSKRNVIAKVFGYILSRAKA